MLVLGKSLILSRVLIVEVLVGPRTKLHGCLGCTPGRPQPWQRGIDRCHPLPGGDEEPALSRSRASWRDPLSSGSQRLPGVQLVASQYDGS